MNNPKSFFFVMVTIFVIIISAAVTKQCTAPVDTKSVNDITDLSIMLSLPIAIKLSNDCEWWNKASIFLNREVLPMLISGKAIDPILEKWINQIDKTKPETKSLFLTLQGLFETLSPERLVTITKNIIGIINESCNGVKYGRVFQKRPQ